jgi:hypothetical protein
MNIVCVAGSYELGGQFTAASGFHSLGLSSLNGVKILPSFTRSKPSSGMSSDCGTIASPTGKGCVAAVFCDGSCITRVSTVPIRGSPVVRSSNAFTAAACTAVAAREPGDH